MVLPKCLACIPKDAGHRLKEPDCTNCTMPDVNIIDVNTNDTRDCTSCGVVLAKKEVVLTGGIEPFIFK